MKHALSTALVVLSLATITRADVIGPSWDSAGSCSAATIASGVPCVRHGESTPFIDLEDGVVESVPLHTFGGVYHFDFLGEITAYDDRNELGWFNVGTASQGIIFSANQTRGAFAEVVIPNGSWLYYRNTISGLQLEQPTSPRQFQEFTRAGLSFLGVEDLVAPSPSLTWCATCSDYDHNDLMVSFKQTATSIPEPTTLMFFGLGLIGAAARLRRKKGV